MQLPGPVTIELIFNTNDKLSKAWIDLAFTAFNDMEVQDEILTLDGLIESHAEVFIFLHTHTCSKMLMHVLIHILRHIYLYIYSYIYSYICSYIYRYMHSYIQVGSNDITSWLERKKRKLQLKNVKTVSSS